jgi:hypothetical protein
MDIGRGKDRAESQRRRGLVMLRTLALTGLLAMVSVPAKGQSLTADDGDLVAVGTVQVGAQEVGLLVSYADDAALLVLEVEEAGYIPLFASTYQGVPAVKIDILAAKAGDAIWVQSNWPGNEMLAQYRFGDPTAVTGFGTMALLSSPLPQSLSGGVVAFPAPDPQETRIVASFYLP